MPTTAGKPVANALIDFWQADARGAYDNSGYRFRGHQLTDAKGQYTLFTVVPGLYPGRTKHIHVKVQAPRKPVLTTQLFFPGVAGNRSDGIFTPSAWSSAGGARNGRRHATLRLRPRPHVAPPPAVAAGQERERLALPARG